MILSGLFVAAAVGFLGYRLSNLALQIPRYAQYWKEQNLRPAKGDPVVYVAMGDSTAQGIGASEPEKGYVGLIAKEIERQKNRPVKIINISKSGARIQDSIRDQLPELAKHKPDYITIEIGANDMPHFDERTFRTEMNQLMLSLPSPTIISDMPYFGGGRRRDLDKNAQAASKIIHELAEQHQLKVAKLYEVTKVNDNIFNVAVDLFHPSNRGYRNWHKAFANELIL